MPQETHELPQSPKTPRQLHQLQVVELRHKSPCRWHIKWHININCNLQFECVKSAIAMCPWVTGRETLALT